MAAKRAIEYNEEIDKLLFEVEKDQIKKDRIESIKKNVRNLSKKNTSGKDSESMMDAITEIILRKSSTNNGGSKKIEVEDRKSAINEILQSIGGEARNEDFKRIARYGDYRIIDEYIPEISVSLDVLRDSILSPDDFSKESAFYTLKDGTTEDNDEFNNKMDILVNKYDLNEFIREATRNGLLLGDDFTIVKNVSEELMQILNEDTFEGEKEFHLIDDGAKILKESYHDPDSEMYKLIKNYYSSEEGIKLNEEANKDIYKSIDNIVDKINKNVVYSKDSVRLLTDKKRKTNYLQKILKGSIMKNVKPEEIVKLEVDHECIGYLYFDKSYDNIVGGSMYGDTNTSSILQSLTSMVDSNSSSSNGSSTTSSSYSVNSINMTAGDNDELSSNGNTALRYDTLVKLFTQGISEKLDKKFLQDNEDLQKMVLSLIKNDYITKKKIAVTYLAPDEVFHAKLDSTETYGKSRLSKSLFFAKLYLISTLTNMMVKINQGRDRRVFYVEDGIDDDFEGSITSLIKDIRSREIPVDVLGNTSSITTTMKTVGEIDNYYIPVKNGKPFALYSSNAV